MEKVKAKKEFIEKWLEALRSGKYKQGMYVLYDTKDDNYCCLGVAGRVCGISKKRIANFHSYNSKFLTPIVTKRVPVSLRSEGLIKENLLVHILTCLNDGHGVEKSIKLYREAGFDVKLRFPLKDIYRYTFSDIADFIEDNVEFI